MELCSFSLLFLLFLNPTPSIAKGGDRISNLSGFLADSSEFLARGLLDDHRLEKLEALAQGYMSNSELETAIREFRRRCADISRVYSIRNSVEGVPLLVIEVSDLPGKGEAKPTFKISL